VTLAIAPRRQVRGRESVVVRERDELRVELAVRRAEAIALCDALDARLGRLHLATRDLGPVAEQLCAGALFATARYRARNEL
jgi:hypothetical protein